MKLYGNPLSPRFRRVATAIAELGAPVDLVVLNPAKGELRSADYLAMNPMSKMPTFEDDDGWSLWESCAVITYLAERFPARELFPTDARGRAEAMRWSFWCMSHLDPSVGALYAQKVIRPMSGAATDETVVQAAKKELERYLPILEAHLAKHPWMLGEHFSLVDVVLGASIEALWKPQIAQDRTPYPHVVAWHVRLVQRPTWNAADRGKAAA